MTSLNFSQVTGIEKSFNLLEQMEIYLDDMVVNPQKSEPSKRFKAPVQGLSSKLISRARYYNLYVNVNPVSRKLVVSSQTDLFHVQTMPIYKKHVDEFGIYGHVTPI